ncbi:MAG: 23S rRNA (adenine(1618)-N(6))-methyltransferase RlmF [Bacteroidota bacterium]
MSRANPKSQKPKLHPRNKNRERYDLPALMKAVPALQAFVKLNKHGLESVDFANPKAVRCLNQALLKHYYGIANWDFPPEKLCPPIPGRADYIHYVADLLAASNGGNIPTGQQIYCLDIGVGASCIYPIIGQTEYGWQFRGSDIDASSIAAAKEIVQANASLEGRIDFRLQASPNAIFQGIVDPREKFDLTICNPPFHASIEEAQKGTRRKIKNLSGKKVGKATLNFSGTQHELIYKGGEKRFLQNMIYESKHFANNCFWFSCLVSKESNLNGIHKTLQKVAAKDVKTIPMSTGNKSTRIVAWTFLSEREQKDWVRARWMD